ncbi:transposase [Streptomyces sp. NPDC004610]|uniref:transposase n=1 Tax=unclassified Streptomyces TaxID=2593676 RepID=UPI0033A65592
MGFIGPKQRANDAEFREGAIRIVIETGKPISELAEEPGVNPGTLHRWVSRWRRHGSVDVRLLGLFVTTSTSKTDQSGKGADRFIPEGTIATSVTTPGRAAEASALGPLTLAGLGDGAVPGR